MKSEKNGASQKVIHELIYLDVPEEKESPRPRLGLKRVIFAIITSVFLHLVLVVSGILIAPEQSQYVPPPKALRARIVPPRPKQSDDLESKQVVSTAKPKENKKPKQAQFSAEHNSSVEHETRARNTSLRPQRLSDVPSKNMPSLSKRDTPQVVPQDPVNKSLVKNQQALSEKGIRPGGSNPIPKKPNLIPTWKDQGMENSMPFSDHLSNIEEDSATRLNTWEWVHASFFVRVKEAVARRWDPNGAIKRNDPRGKIVGKNDRVTQVRARISKDGELLSIQVVKESGVYFLDDAAVSAFKEAAPFSNPPKELFASNDSFEFPFGFMLSYNRGFKFDLDWKPY